MVVVPDVFVVSTGFSSLTLSRPNPSRVKSSIFTSFTKLPWLHTSCKLNSNEQVLYFNVKNTIIISGKYIATAQGVTLKFLVSAILDLIELVEI